MKFRTVVFDETTEYCLYEGYGEDRAFLAAQHACATLKISYGSANILIRKGGALHRGWMYRDGKCIKEWNYEEGSVKQSKSEAAPAAGRILQRQ
jgi:hypothetical protein